jgi:hypothetical protein
MQSCVRESAEALDGLSAYVRSMSAEIATQDHAAQATPASRTRTHAQTSTRAPSQTLRRPHPNKGAVIRLCGQGGSAHSLWQEAAFVDALTGFFHFVDTDRDGNCLFRATILVTALRPLCIASAQT